MKIFSFRSKAYTKSTYTKLIISYILFILLITLILSTVLYYMFYQTTIEVVIQNTNERLGQNINHLNLIRNRSSALGLELVQDSDIKKILYGNSISEEDKYNIMRKLNSVVISDSIVHSIYLYNSKTKMLMSTISRDRSSYDTRMMELLAEYKSEYSPSGFIPSRVTYNTASGDVIKENIISVIFYDRDFSNPDSNESNSSVIVNLKAEDIQKSISSLVPNEKSNIIVVNKDGIVVFDSLLSKFGTDISTEEYIKNIMYPEENKGYSIENVDSKKSLVMYKTYSVTSWTFINISAFESLFSRFYALRSAIIIFCISLLIIGIILSILAARSIYLPFNKLLNNVNLESSTDVDTVSRTNSLNDIEYLTETFKSIITKTNKLEVTAKENSFVIKNAYLKALITGDLSYEIKSINKFKELFEKLFVNDIGGCLSVLIFRIETFPGSKQEKDESDMHVEQLMVETFIMKLISEKYYSESIKHENNYFCIILKANHENQLVTEVKDLIKVIQHNLHDTFNKTITCSMGMPVKVIQDVHMSYRSAADIIKYSFVYGYGSLLSYDMNELIMKKSCISFDKNREKLIQFIRTSDTTQTLVEINRIFNKMKQCPYDYMMLVINQLILEIVKSIQTIIDDDSDDLNFNNIYSELKKIGTLQETRVFFELFCKDIIDRIENKRTNRKNDMISQITKYIDENYFKSDVTTESLAEIANLTPGYFGKLFSEYTGKSVNEYITELRLAKAKELLTGTNLVIKDISSKIGFNSTTYFTKLFKIAFAVTPNQYRTNNKMNSEVDV